MSVRLGERLGERDWARETGTERGRGDGGVHPVAAAAERIDVCSSRLRRLLLCGTVLAPVLSHLASEWTSYACPLTW